MSDRGSSSSEPARNPKFIDLTGFAGIKRKVELQVRQPAGKRAWRSLDELSDTPEFRALMHQEFPQAAGEWDDGTSRRNFLKLMGASIALAGLTTACAPKPDERIVPYVQQPEGVVPGKPLFFATTMPFMGYGKGVLVEQHEGRPTKIEGNPDHPSSLGAADVWGQASILDLYDPDRSQVLTRFGNVSTWGAFLQNLGDALTYSDWGGAKSVRRTTPARVRILTETVTSPTVKAQVEALKKVLPTLVWHRYDPVGRDNVLAAAQKAFGNAATTAAFAPTTAPAATQPATTQSATAPATAPAALAEPPPAPAAAGRVEPIYHFDRAKFIVSLDCNFLTDEPGSLRYARDFIARRRVRVAGHRTPESRLYTIESAPTIAGAVADAVMRLKPEDLHKFAVALYDAIDKHDHDAKFHDCPWFPKLVDDLTHNKGQGLVVAGEYAPAAVHVLAHAINDKLKNISTGPADLKPVSLIPVVAANASDSVASVDSMAALVDAIKAKAVDVVLVLGTNPVYTAPVDLNLEAVLNTAITGNAAGDVPAGTQLAADRPFVAHLGTYEDETARVCEWHLPEAHFLEAWGDVRGHDGTPSIVQPLIAPLYPAAKSMVEVLAGVLEKAGGTAGANPAALTNSLGGYDAVRATWRAWHGQYAKAAGDFEPWWARVLQRGVIVANPPADPAEKLPAGPAVGFEPVAAAFQAGTVAEARTVTPTTGLVVLFRPDPSVWDGSFANNGWLQETPKPLTKLTWDNALLISPKMAVALKLTSVETGNVFKQKFTEALGKTIDLSVGGRSLKGVPVWVVPGHADGCATLHLGYGRRHAGRVGSPVDGQVGFNAYALRTAAARWSVAGVQYSGETGTYQLACTQNQQVINHELNHGRELVLHGDNLGTVTNEFAHHMTEKYALDESAHAHGDKFDFDETKNMALARRVGLPILPDDPGVSPLSLFPEQPDHPGGHDPLYPAWGMVIDQTACVGCNACVVACQAENNVPVVGKDQVAKGRQMQWLRIDTYHLANGKDPNDKAGHSDVVNIAQPEATFFQPMMCVHCEKAPCELVCPVGATVHSKEGTNDMVYNRCVGTRYCSNNCPYKVRRFNFLKWTDDTTPVLKLLRNPEVTVRSRGVMEKCTYCIQRISRGRIEAKKAEVKATAAGATPDQGMATYFGVLDQVVTACQQSCPTGAIVFGNMADPKSKVAQLKRQEPVGFQYGVLQELNTRPRTSYLARINNPPVKKAGHAAGEDAHGHKH